MTFKEFSDKCVKARRKRDIILLSELLDIYDEYYKSKRKGKVDPTMVMNEVHDTLSYSEEEKKEIIQQAQLLRKGQN